MYKISAALLATYLICALMGVIGYVSNVVKLIALVIHSTPVTAMLAGRVVGIFFAPLGAVLGWF